MSVLRSQKFLPSEGLAISRCQRCRRPSPPAEDPSPPAEDIFTAIKEAHVEVVERHIRFGTNINQREREIARLCTKPYFTH